jgi:hypothetical protein
MRVSPALDKMGQGGLHMKRRHLLPEQIIRKLREAERLLGENQIPEVAEELGISEATWAKIACHRARP